MTVKRPAPAPVHDGAAADDDADFVLDLQHGAPRLTGCKRKSAVWTSDDYDETRAIAEGAFAGVAEARHRATGEIVAVKTALPSLEEGSAAAMLREAAFMVACHGHRSFVKLRAISRDSVVGKKRLSLVMEFAGPNLHDVLQEHRRGRPFSESEVRCIMRQLLSAARYMHARGIVHRDIKPGNVLVGAGDIKNLKICDMGLAVSMSEDPPYKPVGTPGYMAPEVLLGKPDYDGMIDTWALGCVMAELLTGEALFDGEDEAEQLLSMYRVVGVPSVNEWREYSSLPLAGKVGKPRIRHRNKLGELFPEKLLSKEGFEVLKGLLSCSTKKRLSAAMALRRPWFTPRRAATADPAAATNSDSSS